MAQDWINRHRGLVFLGVGVLLMIVTNLGQYTITSEYMNTLEKSVAVKEQRISHLTEENKRLSSKSKTFKIIKPDGTIEEKTETELESTSEVSTRVQIEYKEMMENLRQEIMETVSVNRKLGLYGGITSEYRYALFGTYSILGPLDVGGGIILNNGSSPEFILTLGIKL